MRSLDTPADRILFLQRTAGNQAVSRLMRSGVLQAKLRIGQPGDVYEQEADRVADTVMRMPEPQPASGGAPHIQRAYPMFEEDELRRQPIEEEEEELQTKLNGSIQRQLMEEGEETLQTKPLSNQITPLMQRQEEPPRGRGRNAGEVAAKGG